MPSEAQTKACLKCGEQIPFKAIKCKHCGSDLRSWPARHKALTVFFVLIAFPVVMGIIGSTRATIEKANTLPPAPPTAEELAKQKAEQEAFEKSPAGKLCRKHSTWEKDDCIRVADDKIWIGMSLDMLIEENGQPTTKNLSNYGSGSRYQYCWRGISPNCYYDNNDDGIIDAYN